MPDPKKLGPGSREKGLAGRGLQTLQTMSDCVRLIGISIFYGSSSESVGSSNEALRSSSEALGSSSEALGSSSEPPGSSNEALGEFL